MYGFYDNVTLLSYVPKQSKVVLLMSTMHKPEVNPENILDTSNGNGSVKYKYLCQATNTVTEIPDEKPEIIQYYNRTKGVVDTLDQLCATYTCGRSTRRWPLCIFYSMLDIMGVNSYIVYSHYKPEAKESRVRRQFLKTLGFSLVRNYMIKRLEQKTLSRDLRALIIKMSGIEKNSFEGNPDTSASPDSSKRQKLELDVNNTRCAYCPRSANKNCTLRCRECQKLICKSCQVLCYKLCYEENDYLKNE
jgi:hypothetical protein